MPALEKSAGVQLELKDLDSTKGTGVIKHSVYNSIDLAGDISTKGMFTKSWNEAKAKGITKTINLLFNHDVKNRIGFVTNVYDDNEGAYTEFKLLKSKIQDIADMADEGALQGASFGYNTMKKEPGEVKGQRVRKLLEVKHIETSLLDIQPCHPEAGLISLNKAFEQLEMKMLSDAEQNTLKTILTNDMATLQSLITLAGTLDTNNDLYGWIMYMVSRRADATSSIMDQLRWNAQQVASMKSYVDTIDNYCHKAKASDDTITLLQTQAQDYKNIISQYDTAITHVANEPVASDDEVNAMLIKMRIALAL